MILLDSDHFTVLAFAHESRHASLVERMRLSAAQEFGITAVTVEESLRGWLSLIARLRDAPKAGGRLRPPD